MKKHFLSVVLILSMILTWLPISALAVNVVNEEGLCAHHTQHDEFCGYVKAVEGEPCTHEHTDDCYQVVTGVSEDILNRGDYDCTSDTDTAGIKRVELNCQHIHDEFCGYVEAVEGQPCTYVCEICNAADLFATTPMTVNVSDVWDGTVADSYAGGSGTSSNPYLIATAEQLARVASQVNSGAENEKYYKLVNDIYLNDISSVDNWAVTAPANEWVPIGNPDIEFKGNFEGAGHTIWGIYISTQENYQGLFGSLPANPLLNYGTVIAINNVGVEKSYIKGGDYVGGICGYTACALNNCYNSATVIGNNYVGGIVGGTGAAEGWFGDNPVHIDNCYNTGEISGQNYIGGVVGHSDYAYFSQCYNVGSITGTNRIGGIAGKGIQSNYCWNIGEITGKDYVAGILAEATYYGASSSSITSSFNAGKISGESYVGGILGYSTVYSGFYPSTISDCYNVGTLTGTGDYIGGIAGQGWLCKYFNCYNAGNCSLGSGENIDAVCNVGQRDESNNLYYLAGCCGEDYRNKWGNVTEVSSDTMRESDFVSTLNNGGSAWVQDTNEYNSGYPILNGIDYEMHAKYIKKPVDGSVLQKSGTFTYTNTILTGDDMDREYKYTYDESWFFKDSTEYQHDLTKMSMCVALAAYGADDDGNARNILALMEDLNFNVKESDIHYDKPNCTIDSSTIEDGAYPDTIGYIIGSKNIILDSGEDCSLVMIAIRGGGYGEEWGANFRIGTDKSGVHEGFNIAKEQVIEGIKDYFEKNKDTLSSNRKIWICGYSRGGATTNLVAAALDDHVEGVDVAPKNIYAFCFECPRTIRNTPQTSDKKYSNIVNVINEIDFVTKVAMKSWNYSRYGENYYLPFAESTYNYSYSDLTQRMLAEYQKILSYPNKDGTVPKLAYNYSYYEAKGQASILDTFMDHLANMLESPEIYTQNYQSDMVSIFKVSLGGGDKKEMTYDNVSRAAIDYLTFLYAPHPIRVPSVINGIRLFISVDINTNNILQFLANPIWDLIRNDEISLNENGPASCAHFPELCLAWLNALQGEYDYASSTYRRLLINCPVDVSIYDSSKRLVTQITNDIVQEIDGGLVAYIDDNEQKVIALPNSEEYTIKLLATDDGTVTYTATEYNIDSSTTEKVISYYEIAVAIGDELTGVVENLDEVPNPSYPLYFNDESTPLVPTITQDNEEVTEYNVEVTVSGDGNAYGSGTYVNGTFAKVIAVADSGWEFDGWYLGNSCVSTETEYRFLVSEAITLTAKFIESTSGDNTSTGYTITFNATGGAVNTTSLTTGANGKLPNLPTATRTNYTFKGWYTAVVDGTQITTNTVFDKDTTVYAQWIYAGNNNGGSTGSNNWTPPGGNSSVLTTYSITVSTVIGGTVAVNPKSAASGSTITITVVPDANYELNTLMVTDQDGKTIALTNKGDSVYTFVMPNSEVIVNVTFCVLKVEGLENLWDNPFTDVSESTWYYDAVRFVYKNGLMVGSGNGIFSPDALLTRAMMTQTLYNYEGCPNITGSSTFGDVANGAWYTDAIMWATQNGIVNGYGNDLFGPDDNITREQMAVVLWRYTGEPAATDKELHFTDADEASAWALDALRWAVENGIINGKGNGILDPKGYATRAEVAQILKNYLESYFCIY